MKLEIPEPCHENWNKMTPTEKGRFCGSCAKEVIDFSVMDKGEIKNYFIQKAVGSTCGRFGVNQLEEFNKREEKLTKLGPKPWWVAAATLMLFAKQGYSSENSLTSFLKSPTKKSEIVKDYYITDSKTKAIFISGTLVDSFTREPIIFVPFPLQEQTLVL